MAARGTPIEGWWAWWPFHEAQYARRFGSDQDAYDYLPTVRTKNGLPYPVGDKLVMRVAYDHERGEWTNDKPIRITQQEVAQQWENQALTQEVPDERPATPQLEFPVST